MMRLSKFVILLSILGLSAGQGKKPYRICAAQEYFKDCEEMVSAVPGSNLACVSTVDKISCIEKISKGEADVVPLEPEEMYVAHRFLKDGFKVISEVRTAEFKDRDFRYEPVAVVRKSSGITSISELEGKKSCHTGFGRNAGWKIPFSHLMDKKQLPRFCDAIEATTPEKDLYAISNYFKHACAPGAWVPERDKDRELKTKYSNLCSLCENPGLCSRDDTFGGYEGALKCLTVKGADIAWTKMDAVIPFFKLDSQPISITSEYEFLCWDGSSIPLNPNNTCSWAKRPWKAYLTSSRLSPASIAELQAIIGQLRTKGDELAKSSNKGLPNWMNFVLEITADKKSKETDVLFHLEAHAAKLTTPILYLDQGKNYSVTIEKPSCATGSGIRFCVKSEVEKLKCLSLQLAAAGRRVLPRVECVLGENNLDCIQKVGNGQADLVNLSPKDSDWAQQNYGLIPVLSEVEDNHVKDDVGPFRYALAVLRSSDGGDYRNISSLKGKKSCHGSINALAGWNAPLSKLRELKLIGGPTCGLSIEMSQFFGNTSCVPGAKDLAGKTKMPWLPKESLCALCAGDGPLPGKAFSPQTVCNDDPSERYFGPGGALQCLLDGVGSVAFLDHVGLHGRVLANGEINATDFKLLCPNGSTLSNLTNYHSCNWGKVPSNQILTRGGEEFQVKREDVRLTLLKISDTLGPGGKAVGVLKLFGPYFENNDLLFQDTSVGLCDYKSVPEFNQLIREFDYCTTSSAPKMFEVRILSSLLGMVGVLMRLWGK